MLSDLSPAGQALGLGAAPESEAERKKRLQALQQSRSQIGSALGGSNADLSPAASAYLNFDAP
jgi:hypothetical protein